MPRSSLGGPSYAQSQDRSWIGSSMDYCPPEIVRKSRKRKPPDKKIQICNNDRPRIPISDGSSQSQYAGGPCAMRRACRESSGGTDSNERPSRRQQRPIRAPRMSPCIRKCVSPSRRVGRRERQERQDLGFILRDRLTRCFGLLLTCFRRARADNLPTCCTIAQEFCALYSVKDCK